MAVLGSILNDNDAMIDVDAMLIPECFYRTAHRKIYRTMQNMTIIDVVTLGEELKQQKILDEVGGSYYLTELQESVPTSTNARKYANIIYEKYLARRGIEACLKAQERFYGGEDIDEVLDELGTILTTKYDEDVSFSEHLHRMNDEIDKRKDGHYTGIQTGLNSLDKMTWGLQNGDLIVLAGRTSQGKTALMVQIILQAVKYKKVVGLFELEMPATQIVGRMVAQDAFVSCFKLQYGLLEQEEFEKVSKSMQNLAGEPIHIHDASGVTMPEIISWARRKKHKHNLGLLCIDYLQLIEPPKAERYDLSIGRITGQLKGLAKELNIPIILLSQLSRDETKSNRKPVLSDLRNSGNIEQDADLVMFVWRTEKPKIILAKHRNGPTGDIEVEFNKDVIYFKEPMSMF